MGKLASWLGSAKSSPEFVYPPATVSPFDAQRMRGLRYALNSKALGQPTQDYMSLSSHMTGMVHVAVNLIATLVQDCQWSMWEHANDGSDRIVRLNRRDPLVQLYRKPNRIDTTQEFWYDQVLQHELTGMALVWTPPDRDPNLPGAEIAEMWCMPRAGMNLFPPTPDYPQGYWMALPYGMYGNPAYGYYTAGAKIPVEQVMVFKKRHPYYRWEGWSVLAALAQSVTTFESLETSRLSAMLQGCDQSVAIEFPPDQGASPDPELLNRVRAQWYQENQGPANAGKLLFMSNGMKINPFSTSPKEMSFVESFGQIADYLLASFGTPKALVGMVDELTHSTLFGTLKANYLTKLRPLMNKLAARHTKDVLEPFYSESVFLRLEADAVHDDELRERQIDNQLRGGIATVGELRNVYGYELLGEPWEKERAFAGGPKVGGQGNGSEQRDPETGEHIDADDKRDFDSEVERVANAAGAGALGPRMKMRSPGVRNGHRAEAMLHAMEPLKSRGVIHDLNEKLWSNGVSLSNGAK